MCVCEFSSERARRLIRLPGLCRVSSRAEGPSGTILKEHLHAVQHVVYDAAAQT
jgi:hypothetical protein